MIDECWELTNETLYSFSGLKFPVPDGDWGPLAISCLDEAHRRLKSIGLLVDEDLDSSLILMRSLFELAATVEYIAREPETRIHKFQGKLPDKETALEDPEKYRNYFTRSLPHIKSMCEDVGGWASEYYNSGFYNYTSDATHSGG